MNDPRRLGPVLDNFGTWHNQIAQVVKVDETNNLRKLNITG
jgi:hypothetical protein